MASALLPSRSVLSASSPMRAPVSSSTPNLELRSISRQTPTGSTTGNASLIDRLMRDASEGVDVSARLPDLKRAILLDGIDADESGMSPHRIYIWILLLRAPVLPYSEYATLLSRGASPDYAKINDDVFRTLATDPLFLRRVSKNSLGRLLNTVAWTLHDRADAARAAAAAVPLPPSPSLDGLESPTPASPMRRQHPSSTDPSTPFSPPLPPSQPSTSTAASVSDARGSSALSNTIALNSGAEDGPRPSRYLQGMNVLAAPLLYASRSEPQAYSLLSTLLTVHLPAYVQPTMPGVHRGLALMGRLLNLLDPPLAAHLAAHHLARPELYAFPSILTLSACTPPLSEVLILWDFLLAWGVHLNLLAVVAQLVLRRDKLLASDSPAKELRNLGPLRARKVVELVVSFVNRVDNALWEEMVHHTELST